MSNITLYGTKGGTGRLTSAAALALGLFRIGKCIDVIDATQNEPWL
ncbi:MAG: cellulose synthase operon protein YhjQ/BcsQ [Paracoccaceae bacterium]